MDFVSEQRAHCPFCGEAVSLVVDTSAGPQSYIEDCEVCCRPMQVNIAIDDSERPSLTLDCAS